MPILENLTEADIRGLLRTKSMRRARGYLNRVQDQVRVGRTLTAQVRGTRVYDVEIDVEPTGISAQCDCPYHWGGYCKHIGAVLLKWIQSPESFAIQRGAPSPVSGEYPIEVTPVAPPSAYQPKELPFWLTASFEERHRADRQQLETGLSLHRLRDLRRMAKEKGWQVKGTRKADVVQQITEQIINPGALLKATLSLDAEHKRVLRAMVLLGANQAFQAGDLERVAKIWGELKSYKQIGTYTRHLYDTGLVLPSGIAGYSAQNDFVPRVIIRHLPPVLEDVIPAATDLQSDAPASELRLADPYAFVRAANQIALLLEQSPVSLRPPMPRPRLERFHPALADWDYDPAELLRAKSSGQLQQYSNLVLAVPPPARSLPDEAIARLAPVAGDEMRLEFIFSLLVAVGFFQPGSPVTVWQEVKAQFLRQDELAQRAILARVYFQMPNWSALWELLRADGDLRLKRAWNYQYYKPENLRVDLVSFRRLVLRVLASLPDGKWVMLDDLFPVMRAVFPRFDQIVWQPYRYASSTGGWFLTKNGRTLSAKSTNDWRLAQENFIRQIIGGPLHWLGLADLSFSDGVTSAVRFHGLADLYWDRVEVPPAPRHAAARALAALPEDAVTTDDRRISVDPSAISAQAHSLLDRIARLDVATTDRFVYQLDSQATYEAFEAGVALSEILKDWEQLLPIPMSEAIHAQLHAWWDAYGRVRIYENLTVIEFGDDYALMEMKAVTALEEYLIAEISPRLVIVSGEAVASLTAELERAGYTPKQTDEV